MRPEPPTVRQPFNPRLCDVSQLAKALSYETDALELIIENAPKLYTSFSKPKPGGDERIIQPPKRELRVVQRLLLRLLQRCVRYPRWMTGGVPKRSVLDHARPHVKQAMVATFDVKSFFPNTSSLLVKSVLNRLGVCDGACDATLRIVMKDDELPQGGPTSLFLANLALDQADRRISALCRRHHLNFTRYVDDIAISGNADLRGFKGVIIDAIEGCGYEVSPDKIHFMGREVPQVITKLRVNDKLRPTREFITDTKNSIRDCLSIGPHLVADSDGLSLRQLKSRLTGRVQYIKSADPDLGKQLQGMMYGVEWSRSILTIS